jgi:hypothetical protein
MRRFRAHPVANPARRVGQVAPDLPHAGEAHPGCAPTRESGAQSRDALRSRVEGDPRYKILRQADGAS